jgi:predicted transcriptional regulator
MGNPEKITSLKVEDIMEDSPPIVSPKTGLKTLLNLMREYSVVLVSDKGEIKGIISKSDLLGKID